MVNSILITNSGINPYTGGGIVSLNLLRALQTCSDVKQILSTQGFKDNKFESINPMHYGYKEYSPFLMDYLAYHFLLDIKIDIAQVYSDPFGLTVEKLKQKGCYIICDLAPHNIEISKEEHIKNMGKYPFPHLTNPGLWMLHSRHLRLANKVIVHSQKSAEYLTKKANLKEKPHVIPHGCYLPPNIPEYPEEFTPGYFGSLGIDKGISYMASAWVSCPFSDKHKLLLGGVGTERFMVQDEFKPRFKSLGRIENISDFYKQISIYIQPSIQDGFGITPLEAMAHGRPVIVSDGVGMSELVTDGKDGFVVPMRDIKAIIDKIIYFYNNPNEIKRMGAEARKTAEKYSWRKIRLEYEAIYNRF